MVGPGALGCLFAGLLALAGHDVRLLGRRREQTEAIDRDGVRVERDGETRQATVRSSTDPAALGPVELGARGTSMAHGASSATPGPVRLAITSTRWPDGTSVRRPT